MKVTCLSILLLATSAVAFPNGVKLADRRRRTLKTGGGETGKKGMGGMKLGMKGKGSKGSKGMKGKGSKGSKGMKEDKGSKGSKGMKEDKGMKEGNGKKGCQTVKTKTPYSEIDAGISATAVGQVLTYPLYDFYTDELVGTYTDQTTTILLGGEFSDCFFTGSYNLDFDESLEFPFQSQIMVGGTCFGTNNWISGGTGQFACATGEEFFVDGGEDFFASELTICNTCAH
jgi:hypothetical protein